MLSIEKDKGSGGTTETEKHVNIHCMHNTICSMSYAMH